MGLESNQDFYPLDWHFFMGNRNVLTCFLHMAAPITRILCLIWQKLNRIKGLNYLIDHQFPWLDLKFIGRQEAFEVCLLRGAPFPSNFYESYQVTDLLKQGNVCNDRTDLTSDQRQIVLRFLHHMQQFEGVHFPGDDFDGDEWGLDEEEGAEVPVPVVGDDNV